VAISPGHPRFIPILKALAAVIVWGGSFVATKVALIELSPVVLVCLRFAIGFGVLGAIVAARGELAWVAPRELAYFALLGFLGITFHQWLQSNGLETAEASTTAWIVSTSPVFMALLGFLILGERVGWLRAAGIGLAALGVLLVVGKGRFDTLWSGGFGTPGDRLILLSAPNWAVFSVLSRRGLKRHPAARMMFYVMGLGWLFSIPLLGGWSALGEVLGLTARGWIGVLFLGVFCSGVAYAFWYDALRVLPASQVGALLYLEPLVTIIAAWFVLGEAISPLSLAGGALILLGVWVVDRRPA
jgi:drug/metabolite transporter (DMT)-like permease